MESPVKMSFYIISIAGICESVYPSLILMHTIMMNTSYNKQRFKNSGSIGYSYLCFKRIISKISQNKWLAQKLCYDMYF